MQWGRAWVLPGGEPQEERVGTPTHASPGAPWDTHDSNQRKKHGEETICISCASDADVCPLTQIWMQFPPHLVTHHTACPKPDLSPSGVSRLPAAVQLPRNHP